MSNEFAIVLVQATSASDGKCNSTLSPGLLSDSAT
jgi:hypothetical protein